MVSRHLSSLDAQEAAQRSMSPCRKAPIRQRAITFASILQDNRTFTIKPPSADMASLDPDEDPGDASKARAIGRKRNGYGKALGDVVLPEGKTVSGLVESALTTGKRLVGDYSADEELAKRRVARKEGPFHLSVRMPERLAQRFKWRCGAHPHRDAQVSASLMRDGGHISAEQNVDIQYYLPLTRRVVRCLPHKHADVGRSLLATAFCVTSTLNNPLRAPLT